jgi:hypothetical protein
MYHPMFMGFPSGRRVVTAVLFVVIVVLWGYSSVPALADEAAPTFPLSQVKPGMHGVAYTIFSGDQVEKMDLVVIGVIHNALGPKLDVILVQLLGDKPEHTGVVAGMSGSPVYFDGKLAGALSLKLGIFTKEAIGGVTPIDEMLDIQKAAASGAGEITSNHAAEPRPVGTATQWALPSEMAQRIGVGNGDYLVPIETPLIFSGVYPQTLAEFSNQLSALGVAAMAGGTAPPTPDDAKLQPGDMIGMDLVRGDLSLSAGCTVTLVEGNQVFGCGHPLFGFGPVSFPLSRGHVVLTLASSMASTKIMNTGGVIGTLTEDRATAVMGELGPGPSMIPMDVDLTTSGVEKSFHFEVIRNPQLTPLLVAISAFNGVSSNTLASQESTLQLSGTIDMRGHAPVHLDNLFTPTDNPMPTGLLLALDVQSVFSKLYLNPYEPPHVEKIHLHVTSTPERRWATIDSAWSEKNEVTPGETVKIKVLLRPYRGDPFIQEIPVTIPEQTARGTLRLLVSDAETLDRMVQPFSTQQQGQLTGLDQLIQIINRERHDDRLYATLLQPTPTLLIEDKQMPNVPLSEISVLDQRQNLDGARLLGESAAGEWYVDMNQVIAGERYLAITVK